MGVGVMVSVRLVLVLALRGVKVEVGGLEWHVEANLGDGHCWIGVAIAGWCVSRRRYHMLAFETAAVDAGGEGAGAVPRGVEDVVTTLQLRALGNMAIARVESSTNTSAWVLKLPGDAELTVKFAWPRWLWLCLCVRLFLNRILKPQ
jgi:hypothetical protein